jgi:hypothetical protein
MCKTRAFLFLSKRIGCLLLSGAVLLGFTTGAFAQATFSVSSAPITAVSRNDNTARAGEIFLTEIPGSLTSVVGTITISYGAPISCPIAAVSVMGTGGLGPVALTTLNNLAGTLAISVPAGGGAADYIRVDGVRLAVAGTALTSINAAISSTGNAIVAGETSIPVISSIARGIASLSGVAGEITSATGAVTTSPIVGAREDHLNAFDWSLSGNTTSVMVRFHVDQAPPPGVTVTFPAQALASPSWGGTSVWQTADSSGSNLNTPVSISGSNLDVYYQAMPGIEDGYSGTDPTSIETLSVPVGITVSSSALPLSPATISYTASLAPIGPAFDLGGVILAPVPRYAADEIGPATLFVVKGPPCMPTSSLPSGYIAFSSLTYISGTNQAGDRLVVGAMTPATTNPFVSVPLPNAAPDQQFCSPIEIAPGMRVMAYVPTAAERFGDFSAFDGVGPSGLLADPLTEADPWGPFPSGVIPVSRLWGIIAWRIPAQPLVYFSTYTGSSILGVDGRFGLRQQGGNAPDGVARVVRGDMSSSPESIVVGPDGRIYASDPSGQIIRMNLDGALQDVVLASGYNPTGLSFNSLGDLYFNTRTPHTGVWKIPAAQLSSLPAAPTNVIPADCVSPSSFCTGSSLGGGTTFDWVGNLLIVDSSNNRVLISYAPSYNSIAPLITTNLDTPVGIAVDRASGDIFVSNFGSSASSAGVNRFLSNGTISSSVLTSETKGFDGVSRPKHIALDATGVLYIATSQGSSDADLSGGKVWRISFGTGGGLDLLTALCDGSPHPACSSLPPAVGVAVAPSNSNLPDGSYSPPPQELDPVVEPDRLTYDFGPYNYVVDYIGYPAFTGLRLRVASLDTTQAEYQQRVAGTPYEGTTCSIFDGTGGYCEIFRLTCENISSGSTVDCPENPNPYTVTINWNTLETITNPGFLKAPLGTNEWENILTFFSQKRLDPPDPTGSGRTGPRFSDFVFVYNVTGTPPGIAILSPRAAPATYALNQRVLADYACIDPSSVVSACIGTVPSLSPIDTSSLGEKTFEVNATVSSGPSATMVRPYSVVAGSPAYEIFLLYKPSSPGKKGSAFPIKLQVRDSDGRNLSAPVMVLTAVTVTNGTASYDPTPYYTGGTNPGYKFRFDRSLGTGGGYIYNLSTKNLPKGNFNLKFKITGAGNPTTYSVPFALK